MRKPAACGTRTGYLRHRRRGEPACGPCTEANRDYLRAYRAANPYTPAYHARKAAVGRARTRLTREFRTRYLEILAEELGDVP